MKQPRAPLVSICILNYQGFSDTARCLRSLIKTKYPNFEILVVDNGSSPSEAEKLRKILKKDPLRVFRLNKNLGFTGGHNWAFKKTRGKYVVLLNNDTIVKPDWLKYLVETMDSDPTIAAAQPKILMMANHGMFDYSGAAGGYIDKYGYTFTRGRIFYHQEPDQGQYDTLKEIFWASGVALIIRKNVVKTVGGLFDEIYFNYMEDIDLCWRIWRKGYHIVYVPKSAIYHKHSATAIKYLPFKRYWEHRNNLLLFLKHVPEKGQKKIILSRLFFELTTYFFYLATGQFKNGLALFLAHAATPYYYLKMKSQHPERESASVPIFPKSVVLQYFLWRKQAFSQLITPGNTGERTNSTNLLTQPTFSQHQKVYELCGNLAKGKSVIDFGSGEGYGAYIISQSAKAVLGLDGNENAAWFSRQTYCRKNLTFLNTDFEEERLLQKCDFAVCLQTIEHIKNATNLLKTIKKSLNPKGKAVISSPNGLTQSFNENPYHIKEYHPDELRSLLLKYFRKVELFGLHGDLLVRKYEESRKQSVKKILGCDPLKLRNFLPLGIKRPVFDLAIILSRNLTGGKVKNWTKISPDNYYLNKDLNGAIDIIALCQK